DFVPAKRQTYTQESLLSQYVVLYQEAYNGLYSSRAPYAITGWPLFLVHNQDISFQLYLVRLNTILMNVGIIFFAFLITQTIFPKDDFLVLGVPILILFNPQHTHLLSAVNNGNLAELLTVITLYFVIKGVIKGFTPIDGVVIVFFSLLAMWTKATAYFLLFVIGTIALFYLWQFRRNWRWLIPAGLILLGVSYVFLPARIQVLMSQAWILLTSRDIYLDPIVPVVQFRSFWAMPGWLTLQLHPIWYQILAVSCILAVVGLIVLLVTRRQLLFSKQFQPQIQALIILAVAAVVSVGILLGWSAMANTIAYRQGRSIYPVIVPLSLFLMLGWRQLIPATWRNFGLLAITAALFLFDTMVLFHYII
ncbi:MAG: hypothetical protein GY797_38280, partial [Deltaproteobacteria bacterium]|nr:hypothetical protein [Deltaproteobacteria bacterium]